LEARVRIDLGDPAIEFNVPNADADGIYWYVTEFEGWDSPNVRQEQLEPTMRNGVIFTINLYGDQPMSLKGVVKAPSTEMFWVAYKKILAVTSNLAVPFPIKVYETDESGEQMMVKRAGKVLNRMIGGNAFEFEVPLTAPDPVKTAFTI
jgi:hypothetical protein